MKINRYVLYIVATIAIFCTPQRLYAEIVADIGIPVIIKVYDMPVGIEVNRKEWGDYPYTVQYGVLPGNGAGLKEGGILRIKVEGEKDIVIKCAGNSYTVSRE